jgi:hypothetical protein
LKLPQKLKKQTPQLNLWATACRTTNYFSTPLRKQHKHKKTLILNTKNKGDYDTVHFIKRQG